MIRNAVLVIILFANTQRIQVDIDCIFTDIYCIFTDPVAS